MLWLGARSCLILSRPPLDSNSQRGEITNISATAPTFSFTPIGVSHSAKRWSPHPKKRKSLPCVSPWPRAATGVTHSLADSAGSAGHGE